MRDDAAGTAAPLAVTPERLLQDWKQAHRRAVAYLEALDWPANERAPLATDAVARAAAAPWEAGSDAVAETLDALRTLLATWAPDLPPAAPSTAAVSDDAFRTWRLARAGMPAAAPRLGAMPTLLRGTMVSARPTRGTRRAPRPEPHRPLLYGRALRHLRRQLAWPRVAHRRRALLMLLVLVPTIVASAFMVNVLPHEGRTGLEVAIVIFFGALFGWISIGFWTALIGFLLLARGRDRFAITHLGTDAPAPPPDPAARTAIVMPICEEPVERVFAGLRATERSLAATGAGDRFDFFVLSDSHDPDTTVREEEAWAAWCRETHGFGRIFYRRRAVRLSRKSGNVADFCRRWGRRYRYMIVLDADSVMRGETLVRLADLMERHPEAGMIQTAPSAVRRRSLLARAQQFASRVYGPMFAAGLHYWQLGDGQYWGHNTIIRVQPFMDHCALPTLSGREPLGGEILSHDFVEAALMGRAGWTLWLAYDLPGSYEEIPSTLLEEMKRDRRWCQGNLQHLRLLFTEGLFGAHRALFLNGALSYVSALLWNAFLVLSTVEAIENTLRPPNYFPHGPSLFPEWPVWRPDWALALLAVIGMLLFLPKGLSILLILIRERSARAYGGVVRLTVSVLLEILLSSLLAPIRMVFHSRFVMTNLLGRTVRWRSQAREDAETGWGEAVRHHALDTLVASVWGVTLYWLNPSYFWWVTPIIGALILSVAVSTLSSRTRLGDRARRARLFLIPEESDPPAELRALEELLDAARARTAATPASERDGLVRAAVDPTANALRRALLGGRRRLRAGIRTARQALLARALANGPASLDVRERRVLLRDPDVVDELHRRVWALTEPERAERWGRPGAA